MLIQGLLPFFLVVAFPLKDSKVPQYGLEYIFTVNQDIMYTHDEDLKEFGSHVLSRLYCTPKKNVKHIFSCSLRYNDSVVFGRQALDDDFVNRRKNVPSEPFELVFEQREGLQKMIVNRQMKPYDLNVLRRVAENLHVGDDFQGVGDDTWVTFKRVTQSSIGKCSVIYVLHHRPENVPKSHQYELVLLPPIVHLNNGTIVINKTPNLNNCTCYAKNYFRKYGDTIVCKHQQADLESIVSQMRISATNFLSYTRTKSKLFHDSKMFDVQETTKVVLEDIRVATSDPPEIVNPGKTKILANYDVKSMSIDDELL